MVQKAAANGSKADISKIDRYNNRFVQDTAMAKLTIGIGRALTSAYILYSCRNGQVNGYQLMNRAKDMLLVNWSAGSFYPQVAALIKSGLLKKKKAAGNRITFEYQTTQKGMDYLSRISGYFKNEEMRGFFDAMVAGKF